MAVPFVDLKAQYRSMQPEIHAALERVLESCSFVLGDEVTKFEAEFAAYCQARYCVAVNSGTSALHVALLALGIGPGDEVITAPNTFIATCEAVTYVGARPVFVDVHPRTYNIDVTKVEVAVTSRTKAILPVHLYGQPADLDLIVEIAHKHNLFVIEDACQAHGARYKGKRVGGIGQVGCFSFYPGKNLGAYGEGGALVTNDEEIYMRARALRDHGQLQRYHHDVIGYNYRMDAFQGAVLRVKLAYLDDWVEARRRHAALYSELLAGSEVITPFEPDYARSIYHLYVIRTRQRDALQRRLAEVDIVTGLHYPVPCHLQKAYAQLRHRRGDFPVAERCAQQVLSLPMFAELTNAQIETVARVVKEFTSASPA